MEANISNSVPQWTFDKVPPGTTERNSVSGEFFTQATHLESIVRESIQNSLDAQVDKTKPVEVRIYFSGEADKLPAVDFLEYWKGGEERFNHPNNGLIPPIPSKEEDCLFLVVEDFNTTGLTGVVDEKPYKEIASNRNEWNYYNYFFRENGSTKFGSNALGSWGAGKCVFQRASRLKASFAYSVRDGFEPRKFLVGKATLNHHQDENRVTWAPDGWFGVMADEDPSRPDKMLKLPIVDEAYLSRFKERFYLQRDDEPGTSIVIPYVRFAALNEATFNEANLIKAVLENFLIAIQNDQLLVRVKVGKDSVETKISRETFQQFKNFLPTPDSSSAHVTPAHLELAVHAQTGKCKEFELKKPETNSYKFSLTMFEDEQLESLKNAYYENIPILLKVPVVVHQKQENGVLEKEAMFRVAIQHTNLSKKIAPAFYRVGLLIKDATKTKHNSCISVVMIERDALADFLVAAEEPSHTKWSSGTDRVDKGYNHGKNLITFVTGVIAKILDAIDSCNKEAAWDPLSGIFNIPKPMSAKKKPDSGSLTGSTGGDDAGGVPPTEPKGNLIDFQEINNDSAHGFKVVSGSRLLTLDSNKFPMKIRFKVGYDTFSGISWSPNDFILGKHIKFKNQRGIIKVTFSENSVLITVNKQQPFSFEMVGFDANRDVIVDGRNHEYNNGDNSQEASDGISI